MRCTAKNPHQKIANLVRIGDFFHSSHSHTESAIFCIQWQKAGVRAQLSSEREGKKFVSIYGAYRLDRNGANHPYRDSTGRPDLDSNPDHDV